MPDTGTNHYIPMWLLAELTYACPLQCPYCSNPLQLPASRKHELSTEEWLRVMRTVTVPSMAMSYEVLETGKVVRQGQVNLRDMNYQDGFNNYSSGDTLRYEKRMIDRWFKDEFDPKVAAAPR